MSRRKIIVNPPQFHLPQPVELEFWVPGEPRPWQRPIPTGMGGKGYGTQREGPENRSRQEHVYNHVATRLNSHIWNYNQLLPYLPLMKPGSVAISVYFYFPTSGDYTRPMVEDPDTDNLIKNIGDALSGCLIKKPTLLYQNDSQVIGWQARKSYWNPQLAVADMSYPQEVGTMIHIGLHPT